MSRRRQLARAIVASVAVLALSSGSMAQEPVNLLVWDQFTDETSNAAAEKIYNAFMEKHPHIDITREVYQNEQLRTVARLALEAGTGPDVLYYDTGPGNAGVLARAGLLQPIDRYAEQYDWNDRFFELAARESILDDQLYGLGLEFEFVGLFYNKSLFEQEGLKPPTTYDELVAFCQTARDLGYIPMALSMNPGWQAYHWISALAYIVLGEEAMNDLLFKREGRWDTPEMAEAIRLFLVDLKDAECFPEDVNSLLFDDANALFYSGQALMHPTGTWLVGRINANMPDYQVGMIPFPPLEPGGRTFYPTGVGSSFFLSADTEHPDEAALFMDYLFSPEAVEAWVETANLIPPVPFDAGRYETEPLFNEVVSTLQSAAAEEKAGGNVGLAFFINHAVPEAFVTRLRDGSQAVLAGLKTPEELAAEFQEAWEGKP